MADKYKVFVDYGPYDLDTVNTMYDVRFCGMPASFLLLDRRKTATFCHICASLLTKVIPDSKRIEGNLTTLDGDVHSWVEVDNIVYDTSDALIWDKDCYYEREGVLSTKVISMDDVCAATEPYLNSPGYNESFICWIEDLENNLDNSIYKLILVEHIKRFKQEIGYDSLEINQVELDMTRRSLNALYDEISTFKEKNPIKYKRKDD